MNLSDALGVGEREVVALVGAGGKTSALYRLAAELKAYGRTVIATTTTHMWPPPVEAGWPLVLAGPSARAGAVAQAIAEHGRAFVATCLGTDGRLRGIAPGEVAELAPLADIVLVEADGGRSLWLKAPADHEPAMPPSASLVVPIAGLQALGRPLDGGAVHRPERVAALLQVAPGATVTEVMVADLIAHAQGGLCRVPAGARVVPLLNQADDEQARAAGRRIAARLLQAGGPVGRVAVATLQQAPEACEAWAPAAAIVLAAGEARRFGRLKQAEVWEGKPMLARAVDAALASLAGPVIVVLGCEAGRLRALLAGPASDRLHIVENPGWAEGQASSVRAGLAALPRAVQAAVFCVADQPLLTGAQINTLLAHHAATGAPIVAPCLAGGLRSPVLFARPLFHELMALQGDVGGRAVIQRHRAALQAIAVDAPLPYADIDTVEDWQRLQNTKRGG